MSDYSETFTKIDGNTIEAADFETEFQAIETAIATKFDKGVSFGSDFAGGSMVTDTVESTSSGTSVEFTGLPTWVKKITIEIDGVSTDVADNIVVQIGDSGGYETTNYLRSVCTMQTGTNPIVSQSTTTNWKVCEISVASLIAVGHAVITNITGDTWVFSSNAWGGGYAFLGTGSKTLSATLDRLKLFTQNGNNFDAGQINIKYEG